MIDEGHVKELLRLQDGRLFHREGQELEFKEQFHYTGFAEYFRDFAAFANNRGGYLIFGVKDSPRVHAGLTGKSLKRFEAVDPQRITGFLLELFAPSISWDQATVSYRGHIFGVFYVHESQTKPVIAKKDDGKGPIIKNGEIYYRYGGRTQRIQFAELESIINRRIEENNAQWLDLMTKIGKAGPQNAAILDTERALIEKDDAKILVLDEMLADKLKFIREGEFDEMRGAPTLKLVGDVVPVSSVEVVKRIKETLTKAYPYSATELAAMVRRALPNAGTKDVWRVIKENGLKDNPDYSAYNFRNKSQEDRFGETGHVPEATPSIYNLSAINFIIRVIRDGR